MSSDREQGTGNREQGWSYQLSVIIYQLSFISYQLSFISYQLSVISYQLSAISYQLLNKTGKHWFNLSEVTSQARSLFHKAVRLAWPLAKADR
ncbi:MULTISPECIES: hypothetical protein [unclassified Moorena]|uniref:hypothetical protein n=1 Tax=unclassified Moorena TaxID=2683338 RepID=UPI0014015EFD|nr:MULTISPECIES: hypothetical protein [unclassified Moorena]NEO16861.1 hypothetical protein [Moorena sp. SIO3E8]NEQ02640.1 hypothetical protein [Moorena sp. SIO3F7]